jgi:tetratricopeptide (TPR) repeat protein
MVVAPDIATRAGVSRTASRSNTWRALATVAAVVVVVAVAASIGTQYARVTKRSTAGSSAYQAVQIGRFFLDKFSPSDAQHAIEYFDTAIRDDPDYAPAYAGLAEAYNQLGSVFIAGKPPSNVRLLALRAAMRAIELDPNLAEAYAALGYTTMHEMDWTRAEALLRRGIELNPRDMRAHQSYASYLAARRRFAEAIQEGRRTVELEPASPRAHLILAWMLYFDRQYDAAIQEVRAVLQMDRTSGVAHFRLGQLFIVTGRWAEAIAELQTAVDLTHRAPAALGLLAMAYGGGGDRASAHALVDELERRAATENVPPGAVLLAYIGIDDKARAIDTVARGYAERDNYEINIAADPLMDPLRNEPRFEALCQQVMRGTRLALLDGVMPERALARR